MKALLWLIPFLWCGSAAATKLVVLGDSRSEESPSGVNDAELTKLLTRVRGESPDAVFFTGDMTLGLEKDDDAVRCRKGKKSRPDDVIACAPKKYAKAGYLYSGAAYRRQLKGFADLTKAALGAIPFHPLIGNHDALGPDAIDIFAAQFAITRPPSAGKHHLAYSTDVGNAHIAILATDYYDDDADQLQEHALSKNELAWLDQDLKANQGKVLFVMSHEPAFSTAAKDKVAGLDNNPQLRDTFWSLLKANHVVAYLCAHEHLYERSFHDGVWQVITGGGGADLSKNLQAPAGAHSPAALFHYVVITIPATKGAPPHVTVMDDHSTAPWDEFDFLPLGPP